MLRTKEYDPDAVKEAVRVLEEADYEVRVEHMGGNIYAYVYCYDDEILEIDELIMEIPKVALDPEPLAGFDV